MIWQGSEQRITFDGTRNDLISGFLLLAPKKGKRCPIGAVFIEVEGKVYQQNPFLLM